MNIGDTVFAPPRYDLMQVVAIDRFADGTEAFLCALPDRSQFFRAGHSARWHGFEASELAVIREVRGPSNDPTDLYYRAVFGDLTTGNYRDPANAAFVMSAQVQMHDASERPLFGHPCEVTA